MGAAAWLALSPTTPAWSGPGPEWPLWGRKQSSEDGHVAACPRCPEVVTHTSDGSKEPPQTCCEVPALTIDLCRRSASVWGTLGGKPRLPCSKPDT